MFAEGQNAFIPRTVQSDGPFIGFAADREWRIRFNAGRFRQSVVLRKPVFLAFLITLRFLIFTLCGNIIQIGRGLITAGDAFAQFQVFFHHLMQQSIDGQAVGDNMIYRQIEPYLAVRKMDNRKLVEVFVEHAGRFFAYFFHPSIELFDCA
ncbi:hypothetical protein D3C78_1052080 [compost metagenome]